MMFLLLARIIFLKFACLFFVCGFGMKQTFFHRKVGQYLQGGVITTKYAESELVCSMHCARLELCLSANYKVSGVNKGSCELNNNTVTEKQQEHENNHFVYLGKAVWSQRKPEMQEIPSKPSCKELLDDDSTSKNGIYYLQAKDSSQKYPVYCHMIAISGCGGGGWTLVLKTDGDESTFSYRSPLWTNKENYAVEDGLEGLTAKESKLTSYWNTPFKKICLGMTVNGERKWMILDYEASSLYSVIADEQYQTTSAGRDAWKSLITGSSLQPNCNKEGFHITNGRVDMRLGYLANNRDNCDYPDSCIGFGISFTTCDINSDITCGNIAQCGNNDNGNKLTPAFGYVLVQ